jgi:cytidine kinase
VIDLVAFGIIVDDIVFPQGYTRMGVLGGGGPQTAWGMAAARGSGAAVGLSAGVGDDLDAAILTPMHAAFVNLDGVRTTEHPTPRAWQVLEFDGRRTQVWRVLLPTLGVQLARAWDLLPESYQSADNFHWGIHPDDARSLTFAQELTAKGRRVSLEPFKPSDRPLTDSELGAILGACTVFSPNMLEAQRITGQDAYRDILARFQDQGAQILALRRGEQGADVWDLQTGQGVRVPAVPTEVVDVVGAGNAFCGALLAQFDAGLEVAACHAVAAASYMIEQVGLPESLPDPADYARRMVSAQDGLQLLALEDI